MMNNMKAKLFCTTGILAGKKYEFTQQATLGSSSACAIVIDAPGIAPVHARIFYDQAAGSYFVEEGKVQVSTRVDGVPINRKEKLGALHVLTFARQFDFVFQTLSAPQPLVQEIGNGAPFPGKKMWAPSPIRKRDALPAEPALATNGKTLIEDLLKAKPSARKKKSEAVTMIEALGVRHEAQAEVPSWQLEALRGGKPLGMFALKRGENVIGRSPDCEIYIDDPSISRRHASLIVVANGVRVRDLGSRNHTFIDKTTVVSEIDIPVESKLRFGMIEARLVS